MSERLGARLRELRNIHDLSARTLATRAGFSPSFISQIELGQASPSINSLERIAGALGVTITEFFNPEPDETPTVTSGENRQQLTSGWSRASIEILGLPDTNAQLEAVMVTFAPGGRSGAHPYAHPGDEFAIVFDGEITLTLGDDVHALNRGDTVTIPAGTPHSWTNRSGDPASVVMVTTRSTHQD